MGRPWWPSVTVWLTPRQTLPPWGRQTEAPALFFLRESFGTDFACDLA
jgi:hypothetical protein